MAKLRTYNPNAEQEEREERGGGKRTLLVIVSVVVFLALVVGGFFVYRYYSDEAARADIEGYIIDDFTVPSGVSVDGVSLSGMGMEEASAALAKIGEDRLAAYSAAITALDKSFELSAGELSLSTDIDQISAEVLSYAARGTYKERVDAADFAAQSGAAFYTKYVYDPAAVAAAAQKIADGINRDPVDAAVQFHPDAPADETTGARELFTFTEEQPGYTLDPSALTAKLIESLDAGTPLSYTCEVQEFAPEVTAEYLKGITQLVSSYSSNKLGDKNRKFNIEKMAGVVNGTVLQPGDEWSINEAAGPRTLALGWKEANGISGGAFVKQPGGGICQVSGTLYNALIRAEVTITERHPHTIPSTYVPIGLDATINTGGQDLRIKNDKDTPIYLVAYVVGDRVYCEVYGTPLDGYTLDFTSRITSTTEPGLPEVRDASVLPDGTPLGYGESVVWRSARTGKYAAVTKIIKYADGTEKKEEFGGSKYPAFSELTYTNYGYYDPAFSETTVTP